MKDKVLEIIDKLTKHSMEIIKNNEWEMDDVDTDCRNCRSYEEGYLTALLDVKEHLMKLDDKTNRMLIIAYNAICLGQLNDQYDKEELLEELGCTEEEYDEIMG